MREMCDCAHKLRDVDLAPINRVQGNLWQAKYFEALSELHKANKGAARLRRKLDRLRKRLHSNG